MRYVACDRSATLCAATAFPLTLGARSPAGKHTSNHPESSAKRDKEDKASGEEPEAKGKKDANAEEEDEEVWKRVPRCRRPPCRADEVSRSPMAETTSLALVAGRRNAFQM